METKLQKIERLISAHGFDAAALSPSPNFFWLTGMEKHLMERPTTLLIRPGDTPALIIGGFEMNSMANMPFPFEGFPFDDNPADWGKSFEKAGAFLKLSGKKIAVEPDHFRFKETELLKKNIPNCEIVSGEDFFKQLRLIKTQEEIGLMRKAAEIAQNALLETLKIVRVGVSEREISSMLVSQMLRLGCDPNLPFSPIVASGPNTADPHAEVSGRLLRRGEFLLIDWGARYRGFCSDITRVFIIGEPSKEQKLIYETVLAANQAAIAQAKPGVKCGLVDKTARDVINAAGFGQYFTHRVGHGLGLESHEEPYMFGASGQKLTEGMVFTVEPGIYLAGEGGVRIEDDVFITANGSATITDFPRELQSL